MIDSDNTLTLTPLTLAHLTSTTYSSNLPLLPTHLSYLSYLSFLSLLPLPSLLSIYLTSLTSLSYHSAIYVLPSGYRYEDELEGKTGGLAVNQME